jgi:hypothetical protein
MQVSLAWVAVFFLSCSFAWAGEPKPEEPPPYAWKAGVATAKITPQGPMWMAGYAARKKPSEGVLQDLFAKALALEDEKGGRLVIVTLDLIGVLTTLRDAVETRVQEKYGLPPERILLNASHTHSGPEYRGRSGREEEARKYHEFLEQTIVRLVGEAIEALAPAELGYGHARAGFAMNRRLKTDKGYRISPNPEGPVDHDVPVLIVKNPEGGLRAVVFGYACHNTTLGFYEFCGDYAGYAQEYLQADQPGVTAMFMIGCGADQNPYPRSEVVRAEQHGRSLATAVEAALSATQRPVRGPLACALEKIELLHAGEDPGPREYPVQVIRFDSDVTLVALTSEVVVDYSLRLKRELAGNPAVWIAGYSNGYFGYIPSKRVLEEGGYEANPWDPSTEERIIAAVHKLDDQLKKAEE